MTPAAEFNFYFDPEAAYVVLNQLNSPIMMVTWETCEAHALSWVTLLFNNHHTFLHKKQVFITL